MTKDMSAKEAWRAALGELQLQLPRPTFETWLRQTEGVSYDDSRFIVEVPTAFAIAWQATLVFFFGHVTLPYEVTSVGWGAERDDLVAASIRIGSWSLSCSAKRVTGGETSAGVVGCGQNTCTSLFPSGRGRATAGTNGEV